jgi:sugar phosphate permease
VLPKRFFYGWYIAFAASLLTLITVGVGYYVLAVFLRPLQEAHGWSNTTVSAATSSYFIIAGISSAFAGPRVDRRGPIPFIVVGAVCVGVSISLLGMISEVWHLFALYTVLAVGYGISSSVTISSILTRWFVERRAVAQSISATGISLGGMVLVPFGAWLIDRGGMELAGPVLGLFALAIPIPIALLVIVFDPRQMGLRPDGDRTEEEAAARPRRLSMSSQLRIWTIREAMHTFAFWAVLVAFVLIMLAQTGFVIHQIAFLEDRMGSRSAAAFTLSMTAFGSIFARLMMGLFADRMDKRRLAMGLFVLQAATVLALVYVDASWAIIALTLVFGFTLGNVYMLQSLLTSEIFGMMSFGAIFGFIVMSTQIGSGLGPLLIGWLEDRTGNYDAAFMVTAGITLLAAVIVAFARPVPQQPVTAPVEPEKRAGEVGTVG